MNAFSRREWDQFLISFEMLKVSQRLRNGSAPTNRERLAYQPLRRRVVKIEIQLQVL